MMNPLAKLNDAMGQLLGPPEVAEIVITLYQDDQINFQVMGRTGPIEPMKTYRLLAAVAQEVAKSIPPIQETPHE